MHARLTACLHQQLQAASGLSLADFDVLSKLTDQFDGRARVFELVEALQWERSRLSHHLKRMERRGHIARELCPDDGRGALVVLTTEGRSAIEQAAPGHVEFVRQLVFDAVTSDQVEALGSFAQTVLKQIEAFEPTATDT